MEKYIQETIRGFRESEPDERIKQVSTPATNNLFKTRDGSVEKVLKGRAAIFHAIVAKLLFVVKRARPDILLAVSFLTTRVKNPDYDDWNKMLRVLGYLEETLSYHFNLNCSDLKKLTWFTDGSYASNYDKVNTRSSMETELIAVNGALSNVQGTKSFMLEQGYDLSTEIKEDNRSTMLLMRNGRLSSGKRMKHLDIRYFYVKKDLID